MLDTLNCSSNDNERAICKAFQISSELLTGVQMGVLLIRLAQRGSLPFSLLIFSLSHFFAETQRSHVSPDLFNIGEAFGFRTTLAGIIPAQRIFSVRGPNRILFLVIYNNSVNRSVVCFVLFHSLLPVNSKILFQE